MDIYITFDSGPAPVTELDGVVLERPDGDAELAWQGAVPVPHAANPESGRSGIMLHNVSMKRKDAPDGWAEIAPMPEQVAKAKILDIRVPEGTVLRNVRAARMEPCTNIQVPMDMYARSFPSDIPWERVDRGARPMVRYFNSRGLPTKMSCSGHPGTAMKRFWVEFRDDVTGQDVARFMQGHTEPGHGFYANGMFCSRYDKADGQDIVARIQYTAPDMLDAMLDLTDWAADDMSGKPGHGAVRRADAIEKTAAGLCAKNLDPGTADALYRAVWKEHVLEDIDAWLENNGEDITPEQRDYAAERYVYDGKYDCNLSYWDNIENVVRLAQQFA